MANNQSFAFSRVCPAPYIQLRTLSESILDTAGTVEPLSDPIKSYYPRPVESVTVFRTTLNFWAMRAFALERRIAEMEQKIAALEASERRVAENRAALQCANEK